MQGPRQRGIDRVVLAAGKAIRITTFDAFQHILLSDEREKESVCT